MTSLIFSANVRHPALTFFLNNIYPQLYKERFFDIKFISAATGKVRLSNMSVKAITVFYDFVRDSMTLVLLTCLIFVVSVLSNHFFTSIMIQYQHSPLIWVWCHLIAIFYFYNYLKGESCWHFDSCEVSDDEKPRPLPLGLLCFPHVSHSIVSQAVSDSYLITFLIPLMHCTAHILLHCFIALCYTVSITLN